MDADDHAEQVRVAAVGRNEGPPIVIHQNTPLALPSVQDNDLARRCAACRRSFLRLLGAPTPKRFFATGAPSNLYEMLKKSVNQHLMLTGAFLALGASTAIFRVSLRANETTRP